MKWGNENRNATAPWKAAIAELEHNPDAELPALDGAAAFE
jgi:hypothetical protein